MSAFRGGQPVRFLGDLAVIGVDVNGWHQFQRSNVDIDVVQQHVQSHLLARLQTVASEILLYKEERHRAEIEEEVAQSVGASVTSQFGLSVGLTNVRREQTEIEEQVVAHQIGRYRTRLTLEAGLREDWLSNELGMNRAKATEIELLLEQRRGLITSSGTDDEIAEIDSKIAALKNSMVAENIPSIDLLEEQTLRKRISFESVRDVLALPEAPPRKRDDEGGTK